MKFQLFGRLRDNEEEDQDSASSPNPPTNQGMRTEPEMDDFGGGLQRTVERMFSQGYSEEEVRQELQGQYSPDRIRDAINQAVKSSATSDNQGPEPMTPYQGSDEGISPMDEGFNNQQRNEPQQGNMMEQQAQPIENMDETDSMDQEGQVTDVEELVETIVAENFHEIEMEFENTYSEVDEIKERLEDLEERVDELEIRDDEDQQEFIQKVDEMEDHIDQYQSRIGGLEKAFQQVLPSLVDNVRDLTNLVQEMKQEKGIETESEVSNDVQDLDIDEWN